MPYRYHVGTAIFPSKGQMQFQLLHCFTLHLCCLKSHLCCLKSHLCCLKSHLCCLKSHLCCLKSHLCCLKSHLGCFTLQLCCFMLHSCCFTSHDTTSRVWYSHTRQQHSLITIVCISNNDLISANDNRLL